MQDNRHTPVWIKRVGTPWSPPRSVQTRVPRLEAVPYLGGIQPALHEPRSRPRDVAHAPGQPAESIRRGGVRLPREIATDLDRHASQPEEE
jgi:hypothetical protein